VTAAPLHASSIIVEAESFVASNNIAGAPISIISCSGASGYQAVNGCDTPGEWIEVFFHLSSNASAVDTLRSASTSSAQTELRATMFSAGPMGEHLISTYDVIGEGIG
jgi:hypothetical protein